MIASIWQITGKKLSNMHDHADHDHAQDALFHTHAPLSRMRMAFWFTVAILLVELTGGLLSHSLALMSDAGHVLTDIAALGITWYTLNLSQKPPNEAMTFGYHRTGILAALVNGIVLILIAILILVEAYRRLRHPMPVSSLWMFISAGVGLVINLYLGYGLKSEDNLNLRSAMLHIMGDAAASAGVIVGGVLIAVTHVYAIDPILSVLIALLIAWGAWRLVKQTVNILLEGTPKGIRLPEVERAIRAIPGIMDVHDLHVWSIASGRNALSCHVILEGGLTIRDSQPILRETEHALVHLGIGHVTIQTEDAGHPHNDSVLCCDDPPVHQHAH